MTHTVYDFEAVSLQFAHKAANYTGNRYRHWGVEAADVCQEIYVWLYGPGQRKVERWLESDPQQTTRIYRSMLDVALGYAEREKAERVGYKVDDVFWYTPSAVEGLMPLVLDPTWVEEKHGLGELAAMVVDIRRVLTPDERSFFQNGGAAHPDYDEKLRSVVDRLGGDRPHVGRRRPMSNSRAQHITGLEN